MKGKGENACPGPRGAVGQKSFPPREAVGKKSFPGGHITRETLIQKPQLPPPTLRRGARQAPPAPLKPQKILFAILIPFEEFVRNFPLLCRFSYTSASLQFYMWVELLSHFSGGTQFHKLKTSLKSFICTYYVILLCNMYLNNVFITAFKGCLTHNWPVSTITISRENFVTNSRIQY